MKKISLVIFSIINSVLFVCAQGAAGSQPTGITVAGGNGRGSSPSQFENLSHFFIDPAGNIYISDGVNHRVQKWAPGATSGITVAGGNGPGAAANQLYFPYGIYVDAAANIYIADLTNARVQKWAAGATSGVTVAGGHAYGPAANQLAYPGAVVVDAAGNVFIADVLNHRIQKWAPGASEGVTVAGGNGPGAAANQFNQPEDIFIDRTGNMYVADANNSRIQRFTPGATAGVTVAGGFGKGSFSNQLYDPNGVFVDVSGNIYVCDRFNHRIQKWRPGSPGEGSTIAGGNGPGAAANQITYPTGVFVDAAGNLFVDDGDNIRIQKFKNINPPGSPAIGITVAGGNRSGSADNQLSGPYGVFVDPSKNIYIADFSNNRVQKWAPGASSGVTVAGGNGRGSGASQLNFPLDIFVDAYGNIYIADTYNSRVQKWAPGASSGVTVAGGNGAGFADNQIYIPHGIYVDADGNIYVSDEGTNRVQKWAPGASRGVTVAGGNGSGSAANQLVVPSGITLDKAGNIYVTDRNNNRVQKWAPGAVSGITVAGGRGAGSASYQLDYPSAVSIDTLGNIYVADVTNARIQKWVPGASEGITIAGGNGYGSAATQFTYAADIQVVPDGSFYVADLGNPRIQKFGTSNVQASICPENIIINTPSCSTRVAFSWIEPHDTFPASISITNGRNLISASLLYKGSLNGHGYYESNDQYEWGEGNSIALTVGAHLVSINSAAENDFINSYLNQRFNYAWIGLFNTGTAGNFAWVTGEPLHFTNWAPGEPNNLYNDAFNKTIFEPYVHINGYDSLNRWNDNGKGVNARFLAEFDNTVHAYRQISGPANGSEQLPGVYNICYERTHNTTLVKDTCCFSVTVTCNNNTAPQDKSLRVLVAPNPSSNLFKLTFAGNQYDRIRIEVVDVMGKLVESISNATPNESLSIGNRYRPGIYFAQVTQGNKKVVIKLIKQ